jgi:hypothetical protein
LKICDLKIRNAFAGCSLTSLKTKLRIALAAYALLAWLAWQTLSDEKIRGVTLALLLLLALRTLLHYFRERPADPGSDGGRE